MIPWYKVYDLISAGLLRFSIECKNKGLKPGEELFRLLSKNNIFRENFSWINNFNIEDDIESLDPIHIFASITDSGLHIDNRLKRIKILLGILTESVSNDNIDFDGCPSLSSIKLVAGRDEINQEQIWDLFERLISRNAKGLVKEDFENYKNWYGINYTSFTVFLFWANSNSFLPFDKNTELYLTMSTGFIKSIPKAYTTYIALLNRIQKFNSSEHERFGSYGIYREITHAAYQIVNLSIKDLDVSDDLRELLGRDESDTENRVGFDFKIIAIKPLKGCLDLNNLEQDRVYHFEKTIEIKEDVITYYPERNIDLYKSKKDLKIGVTAIVGKNGSGKSSLIELFFRIINNISFLLKQSLKNTRLKAEKDIRAELYYTNLGILYKVVIIGTDVTIQEFNIKINTSAYKPVSEPRKIRKRDLNSFFYTVAVNYSHYALNSKSLGEWIESLFVKNDAYQTPIVISPMRINGNIDINKEDDFALARLISNLLEPISNQENIGFRQMTENQKAYNIEFKFLSEKSQVQDLKKSAEQKNEKAPQAGLQSEEKQQISKLIMKVFEISEVNKDESSYLINETKEYINSKLVRISQNYSHYSKYYNSERNEFFGEESILDYLFALKKDSSHITFKLKQAINFWKYPNLWRKEKDFIINIEEASINLQVFFKKNNLKESKIIEYIPPAFFKAKLILVNRAKTQSSFNFLSSGEKQLIYSASSILYHLQNLDSVEDKNGLVKYRNVSLILDEIELYYHPDLQRRYIDFLLTAINKIEFDNIKAINICMVTHSPYVLSDIPDNFTLKLNNGIPDITDSKTFGANIHDLLANDFFMEDGYMGEFAKKKIEGTIRFLNYRKLKKKEAQILSKIEPAQQNNEKEKPNKELKKIRLKIEEFDIQILNMEVDYHENIIAQIGEPIIQNKLKDMLADIMPESTKQSIVIEKIKRIMRDADVDVESIKKEL